jgi:hypothetical protein
MPFSGGEPLNGHFQILPLKNGKLHSIKGIPSQFFECKFMKLASLTL